MTTTKIRRKEGIKGAEDENLNVIAIHTSYGDEMLHRADISFKI